MSSAGVALNLLGVKAYLGTEGATSTTGATELSEFSKISNPGGVERNIIEYFSLTSGYAKQVPTTMRLSDITLEIPGEDKDAISALETLAKSQSTPFAELFVVYPAELVARGRTSFHCTVAISQFTPGDVSADGYDNYTITFKPSGAAKALSE